MDARSRRVVAASVTLGVVASGLLVWQASYAAFSATTTNPNNTFAAGTVVLTDDHQPGTALFSASALAAGDSGSRCIAVTYNGSLAAAVRMYVKAGDLTNTTGDLSPYLTLKVEQGTGSQADCSDFVGASNVYNATGSADTTKTLSDFASTRTDFGTGVGAFAPTGPGQTTTYRVSYWVQDNNAAQGKNDTVTFTWEAQNS
jgi:hypothetical protein